MRAAALVLAARAGCAGAPPASSLLVPADPGLAKLQTRRFEGVPPAGMLSAAVSALQDLGFQVTSSDAALGLVVARRGYRKSFAEAHRDWQDAFFPTMRHAFTFQWSKPPPEVERLAATGVLGATMTIAPQGAGSAVRIAFHRYATKLTGEPVIIWAEELREPEPYRQFFEHLSRALAAR